MSAYGGLKKREATKARDRALAACDADKAAEAREAWSRVLAESKQGSARLRLRVTYARVAMLQALAEGKSVKDAEDASMEALWG